MKVLMLFLLLLIVNFPLVFAETQEGTSSGGSLVVKLDAEAIHDTKLKIEFVNPQTKKTQEHIDYTVEIENDQRIVFGPTRLVHTSTGIVSIPATMEDGTNKLTIRIEGILFMIIPQETVSFDIVVGDESVEPAEKKVPAWVKNNAGWWATDQIDDGTFISGIQYLIKEGIIAVSAEQSEKNSSEIPSWVKNNAGWWAQDLITDNDFLKGIEYLIRNGIISVASS